MPVTLNSVVQVVIFLVILLLLTKPMGLYLTKVFAGERTWLTPVLRRRNGFFTKQPGSIPKRSRNGGVMSSRCCSLASRGCCSSI